MSPREKHNKLIKGLIYLVIIVASLMILIFMDNEEVKVESNMIEIEMTRIVSLQPDHIGSTCDVLHDDLTIITGDLGISSEYLASRSSKSFAVMNLTVINNPIIAYFDDKDRLQHFSPGRFLDKLKYMTKLKHVDRTKSWSYQLLPKLKAVLDKSHTKENSEKQAKAITAQHLKYELVYKTIMENPFCTKYFAWIEMDILKNITTLGNKEYNLYVPSDLEQNRTGFYQIESYKNLSSSEIFKQDKTWICEDIFVGEKTTLAKFVMSYMKQTVKFLNKGLVGSERNILYAMNANDINPEVKLQVYEPKAKTKRCSDLALLLKSSGQSKSLNVKVNK